MLNENYKLCIHNKYDKMYYGSPSSLFFSFFVLLSWHNEFFSSCLSTATPAFPLGFCTPIHDMIANIPRAHLYCYSCACEFDKISIRRYYNPTAIISPSHISFAIHNQTANRNKRRIISIQFFGIILFL